MFDRLPTPWGLVRAGVAPDHPNIKAVSRVYEKTAEHPEFRFYGNVELGRDLTHDDLMSRYHAVVYAVGAQTDRRMGIPGEDLPGELGRHRVRRLVQRPPGLPRPRVRPQRASARWSWATATWPRTWPACSRSPATSWPRPTWPTTRSRCSPSRRSREIVVLGRRGPAQAAFTNPELLELGEMTDADVFVDPGDVELDPLSKAFIESEAAHTTKKKNVEILTGYAGREPLGQAAPDRAALPRLAGGDPRHRPGRGHPHRPQRAGGGRRRLAARPPDRHHRGARLRAGVPLDRISGHPHRRRAVRRAELHDPQRARRASSEPLRASTRWAGSSAGPPGSSARTSATRRRPWTRSSRTSTPTGSPRPPTPSRDSMEALLAERQPDAVSYAGWQAVDRGGARGGRAAGPPAREAVLVRGAARGREGRYAGALTAGPALAVQRVERPLDGQPQAGEDRRLGLGVGRSTRSRAAPAPGRGTRPGRRRRRPRRTPGRPARTSRRCSISMPVKRRATSMWSRMIAHPLVGVEPVPLALLPHRVDDQVLRVRPGARPERLVRLVRVGATPSSSRGRSGRSPRSASARSG